jgi:small nuclear ribonucleoprotein
MHLSPKKEKDIVIFLPKGLNQAIRFKVEGSYMVMPTKVLENSMNKKISLLLKDSRILEGKLVGFDDYMNMVLENTEETFKDEVRRLGTIIIRGNNVVSISPK